MPLIAIVTIILAAAVGLRWVFRSPVGEALAQRLREGRRHAGTQAGSRDRADLEDRVAQLQEHVVELTERVDFAERLLSEQRQRQVRGGD